MMDSANTLIQELTQFCIDNYNENNIKKYQHFFKEAHNAYGLSQTLMDEKIKEIVKTKKIELKVILQAAPNLIETGKYELISFPIYLLNNYHKQFDKQVFYEVEKWFNMGINNWAHADGISSYIIHVLITKKIISFEDLKPWLYSKNKFQRRVVPVSFIKPLKENIDLKEVLKFIEPLMHDKEREVHQGVGWFLREAWKKYPSEIEEFLLRWKNTSPRLIIQYATEKMNKEEKLRFKKEK